jgi:hypothetical protein
LLRLRLDGGLVLVFVVGSSAELLVGGRVLRLAIGLGREKAREVPARRRDRQLFLRAGGVLT